MSRILKAAFDNVSTASAAFHGLLAAGVERRFIDSYRTLDAAGPQELAGGERVLAAETSMSTNGPLGHLHSVVAQLFGAENLDDQTLSSGEPTEERTGKSPVFLLIHLA